MRSFRERFGSVVRNWWDIMRQQKRLTWFTSGYGQAAIIFPILVAAPRYFRGEIPLGALMQTSQAFGQVQDSLSFIITSYTDIAEWRAVVLRLLGFERALARVRADAAVEGVRHGTGAAGAPRPGPGDPRPARGPAPRGRRLLLYPPSGAPLPRRPSGAGQST